ncbi:MAG: formylglycine-generating enzyme family protein [Endomicrobia bacterium]|nr:formylglycine-generating enzyme family protein [Endomicrobiia bacterium]
MRRSIFIIFFLTLLILIFAKKIFIPQQPGMVYIPPGEVTIGNDSSYPFEGPKQKVLLKAFFIDKTEVTNKQYKRFIDNTGYMPPPHWKNNTYPEGEDDLPVVNVSLEDAQAYAKWAGKRLPTELEWEKAARGTDGRIFPWGNFWETNAANIGWLLPIGKTKKVSSHQLDVSVYGCYDMGGNVREWTMSKFEPYPGYIGEKKYFNSELYVVRGGSYKLPKTFCFTYRRDALPKTTKLPDLGFRCVKDVK